MIRCVIEHAIKELNGQIEDLYRGRNLAPAYEVDWRATTLELLRAELSRQENAPLTCDGCRREDFQWVDECIGCVRQSHHEDRYEPKGEKE